MATLQKRKKKTEEKKTNINEQQSSDVTILLSSDEEKEEKRRNKKNNAAAASLLEEEEEKAKQTKKEDEDNEEDDFVVLGETRAQYIADYIDVDDKNFEQNNNNNDEKMQLPASLPKSNFKNQQQLPQADPRHLGSVSLQQYMEFQRRFNSSNNNNNNNNLNGSNSNNSSNNKGKVTQNTPTKAQKRRNIKEAKTASESVLAAKDEEQRRFEQVIDMFMQFDEEQEKLDQQEEEQEEEELDEEGRRNLPRLPRKFTCLPIPRAKDNEKIGNNKNKKGKNDKAAVIDLDASDEEEEEKKKKEKEDEPPFRVVDLPPGILSSLKPHQIEGIRFIWGHVAMDSGFGCILADDMGMGKTFQMLAVCSSFLAAGIGKSILVVAPAGCVHNWEGEARKWLGVGGGGGGGGAAAGSLVNVYTLANLKNMPDRAVRLQQWKQCGGMMLMSFDMYRILVVKALRKIDNDEEDRVLTEIANNVGGSSSSNSSSSRNTINNNKPERQNSSSSAAAASSSSGKKEEFARSKNSPFSPPLKFNEPRASGNNSNSNSNNTKDIPLPACIARTPMYHELLDSDEEEEQEEKKNTKSHVDSEVVVLDDVEAAERQQSADWNDSNNNSSNNQDDQQQQQQQQQLPPSSNNESENVGKGLLTREQADIIMSCLCHPGPDLIILDEGHRLKSASTELARAFREISTKRRVVLTGYPVQNKPLEYFHMVDFIRSGYLGTKEEFCNRFNNPIMNGLCVDSSASDKLTSRKYASVLYDVLKPMVLRRTTVLLQDELPPRHEFVINVRMTDPQYFLYMAIAAAAHSRNSGNPIPWYHAVISLTLHPLLVCSRFATIASCPWEKRNRRHSAAAAAASSSPLFSSTTFETSGKRKRNQQQQQQFDNNANENSMFESPIPSSSSAPSSSSGAAAASASSPMVSSPLILPGRMMDAQQQAEAAAEVEGDTADATVQLRDEDKEWVNDLLSKVERRVQARGLVAEITNAHVSHKLSIAWRILELARDADDRVVLFSQRLGALDLFQEAIEAHDRIAPPHLRLGCYRIDGSVPSEDRKTLIAMFNKGRPSATHPKGVRVFLISKLAGGEGVTLTGANRVIMLDTSWNPCHDAEAAARVYRLGQMKPVFIYRLVIVNTMEANVYERSVLKHGVSLQVIDDKNPEKSVTKENLRVLMSMPKPLETPTPCVLDPNTVDVDGSVLAKLVADSSKSIGITDIRRHDSRFQHDINEQVSSEARRAARLAYEASTRRAHGILAGASSSFSLHQHHHYHYHHHHHHHNGNGQQQDPFAFESAASIHEALFGPTAASSSSSASPSLSGKSLPESKAMFSSPPMLPLPPPARPAAAASTTSSIPPRWHDADKFSRIVMRGSSSSSTAPESGGMKFCELRVSEETVHWNKIRVTGISPAEHDDALALAEENKKKKDIAARFAHSRQFQPRIPVRANAGEGGGPGGMMQLSRSSSATSSSTSASSSPQLGPSLPPSRSLSEPLVRRPSPRIQSQNCSRQASYPSRFKDSDAVVSTFVLVKPTPVLSEMESGEKSSTEPKSETISEKKPERKGESPEKKVASPSLVDGVDGVAAQQHKEDETAKIADSDDSTEGKKRKETDSEMTESKSEEGDSSTTAAASSPSSAAKPLCWTDLHANSQSGTKHWRPVYGADAASFPRRIKTPPSSAAATNPQVPVAPPAEEKKEEEGKKEPKVTKWDVPPPAYSSSKLQQAYNNYYGNNNNFSNNNNVSNFNSGLSYYHPPSQYHSSSSSQWDQQPSRSYSDNSQPIMEREFKLPRRSVSEGSWSNNSKPRSNDYCSHSEYNNRDNAAESQKRPRNYDDSFRHGEKAASLEEADAAFWKTRDSTTTTTTAAK